MKSSKFYSHKDLEVWKRAIQLIKKIYQESAKFPKEELYGLTIQIRRSAVSIPSNIAEGAARQTIKEFIHFLYIALGSIAELETQLIVAQELDFINSEDLLNELSEIRKMLIGLIKYQKKKKQ
ncbi:MAG: four helix bundle protein [Bacteroidales bacterium]|nr:MAG: four helix bundle protein [Bacteroidales bacterium]